MTRPIRPSTSAEDYPDMDEVEAAIRRKAAEARERYLKLGWEREETVWDRAMRELRAET